MWHFSAVPTPLSDVGYPGHTGKHLLVLSFTGFDPKRKSVASNFIFQMF
jgi:hypothetical protein